MRRAARPHGGMANYADATRTPRTLTEREQRALLKVTGEHRAGYRDHVLYAMALGTGLREHELIALSVGDVFRDGSPRRRLLLSVFKGAPAEGSVPGTMASGGWSDVCACSSPALLGRGSLFRRDSGPFKSCGRGPRGCAARPLSTIRLARDEQGRRPGRFRAVLAPRGAVWAQRGGSEPPRRPASRRRSR